MCKAVKVIVKNYLGEKLLFFLTDHTMNYVTYTALVRTSPENKKLEWFWGAVLFLDCGIGFLQIH